MERAQDGYVAPPDVSISDAESIPKFLTKLSKFFPQCKPRKEKTYTKVHFTFSTSLDDILDDLREELSHANFSIYKQSLQHWDVSLAGWVVYFDPRGEAKCLTECLMPAARQIVSHEPMFAFKFRKIYNGPTDFSTEKRTIRKKKNYD